MPLNKKPNHIVLIFFVISQYFDIMIQQYVFI